MAGCKRGSDRVEPVVVLELDHSVRDLVPSEERLSRRHGRPRGVAVKTKGVPKGYSGSKISWILWPLKGLGSGGQLRVFWLGCLHSS